ncbi:MAG: FAD-dependent oxidoreductase [Myxococcota bacterium]|nr:FAD-dependent oxidoreductase [Myxococcota bacterium]
MKIGVIGGGIVGLSAGWAALRRGFDLTLFEQGDLPNPRSSSCDAHRLIRDAYGADRGYTLMVQQAWGAWERLWGDLGICHYVPTGTLALATESSGWTHDSLATLQALGLSHTVLDREETTARFHWLNTEDVRWSLYLDSGGALLADRILASLSDHLAQGGAALHANTKVIGVDPVAAKVETEQGLWEFDALVLAAGPWSGQLWPELLSRVTPSRQILAYAEPPPDLAEAWETAPMLLDVGSAGFYCVPPVAGTGLKIGDHTFSLQGDPDGPREAEAEEVRAVFETARPRFRDFDRYRLTHPKVCFYTVEPAERFLLLQRGACWIATGLSGHGFKFGPLLGEELAKALAGEGNAAALEAWAAGRV